jgi:hypothetical protein
MYHLPPSYPADLIFLPKTDCGLNFKLISDLAQILKWGMLGRTSALGPASTSITHSLIKRAIETPHPTVLFATSLVEWGSLNKMSLSEVAPGARSITPEVFVELVDQLKLNAHDIESLPIGGIFSDDFSFSPAPVSPSELLTHPSRLLQIGHGGIAVVWTPPPSLLLTSPPRILYVSALRTSPANNSFKTLELLGQISLYKFSRFVPTHIAASSDCQSVVAFLQET